MTSPIVASATILIVDDELQNRRLLEVLLRPEGYRTRSAASGEEALASIAECAPDMILLDIMMPGMDGYQVAGLLKANPATANIPIIMVTAQTDRNARLAGLDAGAEDFLTKPVDRAELWLRVRNLLRLKAFDDFLQNHSLILEQQVQARTADLRARELRYQTVVTSAPDAFVTSDAAGRIVGWNPSAERIFGYSETEVIGQPLTLLIPQRFQDRHLDGMKRVQSGGERRSIGKTVELVGRRKDASEFPLELSLSEWSLGEGWLFNGIIRDISERSRADDALRAAEEQFRGLVEQSISGIYIIQDDKLAYVNPHYAEILGYASVDELIGRDQLSIVAEKDRGMVTEKMRLRLEGNVPSVSYSFTAVRKDGAMIEVGVHGARATHNGRPAIIGLLQDISDEKRTEEEIRRYVAQIETAFMSTVRVVTTLGELRDPYTAGHQRKVAEIAAAIGAELGFDAQRQEGLRVAGYLHDIGKITIPSEILSKPGKLSAIQLQLVRGHAQASYEVLKGVEFPWPVAEVALQHHERMDGSGYPQGLKGKVILLEARIMAVADVLEAMASHRPYREALGIDKALAEIERGRGTIYDPAVADTCVTLFRERGYAIPT